MSKREQTIGRQGQELAASALRRVGVELVEEIGTPFHLIPHPRIAGYYRVIFGEKVSGDHRGVLPGGRSVLAETKTITDRPLRWSDFREHQPGRLDAHAEAGGVSLVVWVNQYGAHVLHWPIMGFGPGKSVSFETARDLEIGDLTPFQEGKMTP
jgi:hypothetical protein